MASINLTLPDDTLETIERQSANLPAKHRMSSSYARFKPSSSSRRKPNWSPSISSGYELYPETEEEISGLMAAQMDSACRISLGW